MTIDPYGAPYWDRLDGGRGYQDSVMWQDLAFLTHHLFAHDPDGTDRAGEFPHIDVGCAMGYMVRHMRRRGFESFGLDYSKYALDQAPNDISGYLRWFDLTDSVDSLYGRERFRLLTCFETLEHIPAEAAPQAIEHLWNLMRPGGDALVTICTRRQPGWETDPTHINVVNRGWWVPLFVKQGFLEKFDLEDKLQGFHLFRNHYGVFVLRKP